MPNHTWNRLTVTGPSKNVEAFRVKVDPNINPDLEKPPKDNPAWLSFQGTVPMPKELIGTTSPAHTPEEKKADAERTKLYGAGNWYDFNVKNYGTKWDAYDQSKPEKIKNGLVYEFHTAWSTPEQWVHTTAKIYPTLNFEVEYKDEDSDNSDGYKYSFIEYYQLTHQKLYKNFLKDILSPEFDASNKYRDFDKDVLKRIEDEDLPLLVNFPWDNKALYIQRLSAKTTTKKKRVLGTPAGRK